MPLKYVRVLLVILVMGKRLSILATAQQFPTKSTKSSCFFSFLPFAAFKSDKNSISGGQPFLSKTLPDVFVLIYRKHVVLWLVHHHATGS